MVFYQASASASSFPSFPPTSLINSAAATNCLSLIIQQLPNCPATNCPTFQLSWVVGDWLSIAAELIQLGKLESWRLVELSC